MRFKRMFTAAVLILSFMITVLPINISAQTLSEDNAFKVCSQKLSTLDVLPYYLKNYSENKSVTREDFLTAVSILFKITPIENNYFTDIEDLQLSGYAAAALGKDAVALPDEEGKFYPKEKITPTDAVKMVVAYLGYGTVLQSETDESMKWAEKIDILDGLYPMLGKKTVTYKEMLSLLNNALYVHPMVIDMQKDGKRTYSEGEETLLEQLYDIKEEKVKIIEIRELGNGSSSVTAEDSKGNVISYNTVSGYKIPETEGTLQYIWINENDEIILCYSTKSYEIIYDYVVGVNKSDDTKMFYPSAVRNIEFAGNDEIYSIGKNFKMYHNGKEVTDQTYVNGTFVRAVIEAGKITSAEIFSQDDDILPSEGGIIAKIEDETILYRKGISSMEKLEIGDISNVTVIINGAESSYSKLKKEMIFEYCRFDNKTIIIADNWAYEGIVTSVGQNGLYIGEEYVPISYRQIYISENGGMNFTKASKLSDLKNNSVKILVDATGSVRYIISEKNMEIIGIVMSAYDDESTEDEQMKLACVGDEIITKTYKVDLSKSSEVSFVEAASNKMNENGEGIYRFKISNGVIKKISKIEWNMTNGAVKTITGTFPGAYAAIDLGEREKGFNENCIISLKDYKGEFNPQLITWPMLQNKKFTNLSYRIDDKMPTSEIFVITSGLDSLMAIDSNIIGIVTEKDTQYDFMSDEITTEYTLLYNGISKKLKFNADEDTLNWNENDIIIFSDGGGYTETGNMKILSKDRLFPLDEPKGIGGFLYDKVGTYIGMQGKMIETSLAGEDNWYFLDTNYKVFSINGKNKVSKSSLDDAIGKSIYVLRKKSRIYCIFFIE